MDFDVIIPTRGAGPLLQAAVASALSSARTARVIVAHDRRDGEAPLDAARFFDPRVQVVASSRPGPAAARNAGLAAARSPRVAFLDDDDLWEPGHLEQAAAAFEKYPRAVVFACGAFEHREDADDRHLHPRPHGPPHGHPREDSHGHPHPHGHAHRHAVTDTVCSVSVTPRPHTHGAHEQPHVHDDPHDHDRPHPHEHDHPHDHTDLPHLHAHPPILDFDLSEGLVPYRRLLEANPILTPASAIALDRLETPPRFDEDLAVMEDYDLWLRLARKGDIAFDPRPTVTVRRRAGSASRDLRAMAQCGITVFERALAAAPTGAGLDPGAVRARRARLWHDLAYAHLAAGETRAARDALRRAIPLAPFRLKNYAYAAATVLPKRLLVLWPQAPAP